MKKQICTLTFLLMALLGGIYAHAIQECFATPICPGENPMAQMTCFAAAFSPGETISCTAMRGSATCITYNADGSVKYNFSVPCSGVI